MIKDYEKELQIDILSLDTEWIQQPRLFMKYADLQSESRKELDELKQKQKVKRSELLLEAAEGGEELIGSKPTVSAIDAWVESQKSYKELVQQIIDKEYELNILTGAVRAFDQKKAALENLVRLWQGSYFSGPREPKDYTATDGVAEQVKPTRKGNKNGKKKAD